MILTSEFHLVLKLRIVEVLHARTIRPNGPERENFAFQKMKINKSVYIHCLLTFTLNLLRCRI